MRTVITIAGSDSIAGAGVQGDLKTFAALGLYGTSVITAVTSQNTAGVSDVFFMPAHVVRSQIESVLEDVTVSAVKTGMLGTSEIVITAAEALGRLNCPNLVVDPVMAAGSGDWRTLLAPDAVSVLKSQLFPLAHIVTPNVPEARILAGISIESLVTAREAAKRIFDLGARAVVVKGGHLVGSQAIDILYDGRNFTEFSAPRCSTPRIHGTGCAFASAVAAGLALGDDTVSAVDRAKRYVTGAIQHAESIGHGAALLDHFWQRGYTERDSI